MIEPNKDYRESEVSKVREIEKIDYDPTHKDYNESGATKVRENEKVDYDTTHKDYRESENSGGKRFTPAPPFSAQTSHINFYKFTPLHPDTPPARHPRKEPPSCNLKKPKGSFLSRF